MSLKCITMGLPLGTEMWEGLNSTSCISHMISLCMCCGDTMLRVESLQG